MWPSAPSADPADRVEAAGPARPAESAVALVVAGCRGTADAERALHTLRVADAGGPSPIAAVAALAVEWDGAVRVLELTGAGHTEDPVYGAALGVGLRALMGGIGWPVLDSEDRRAGIAGHRHGQLEALGKRLTPGSSVLVAVVAQPWVRGVARRLSDVGAETVTVPLDGGPLDGTAGPPAEGRLPGVRSDGVGLRIMAAGGGGGGSCPGRTWRSELRRSLGRLGVR